MDKKYLKTENEENLQQKFQKLKFCKEKAGFEKFMKLHEEINSYSQENEEQVLIGLDNSTEIINP